MQQRKKDGPVVKESLHPATINTNTAGQAKKEKKAVSTNIESHLAAAAVQNSQHQYETSIPDHLPEVMIVHDVDKDDAENPQCCTEYVHEIFQYMSECETREVYAVSDNFLAKKQIQWSSWQRSVLINWLVDVHRKYGFVQETLFITVDCFDRYIQVYILYIR